MLVNGKAKGSKFATAVNNLEHKLVQEGNAYRACKTDGRTKIICPGLISSVCTNPNLKQRTIAELLQLNSTLPSCNVWKSTATTSGSITPCCICLEGRLLPVTSCSRNVKNLWSSSKSLRMWLRVISCRLIRFKWSQ